jgi:hypothetical protein
LIDRFDAEGVVEVVAALEKMEAEATQGHPLGKHDGVACFDYLYTIITKNVLRCVQDRTRGDDPRFHDRAFMACLDVAFANRYLAAMGEGEPPFQPRCWQSLLDHRDARDISPLIFAVAGVNAHVNFDLPFALVTACTVHGCELDSGTNHQDYQLINQIFSIHMQQLRQHFENRFQRGFDEALVAKVENMFGDLVVLVARNLAWSKAKQLWQVHQDEARMLRLARSRDRWVALSNWSLFQLDRLPAAAFRGMDLVPGPSRRMAKRGLGRTGWGASARPQGAKRAPPGGAERR